MVAAAVADVDDGGSFSAEEGRHQGGAHTGEFLKLPGLVVDGEVCQLQGVFQQLLRLLLGHAGLVGAKDLVCEYIYGKSAGDITGLCAAHAITDRSQDRISVQLFDPEGVLVHGPDLAGV